MEIFEYNSFEDQYSIRRGLQLIETNLTLLLNSQQVSFQQFYNVIYHMQVNEHGNLISNLTSSKITEVFQHKLQSINRTQNSLAEIFNTLREMVTAIDNLLKVYFLFEEAYYQIEKNTSLKVIGYNIIKELLVKEESLFVEFLSQLSILIFKVKNQNSELTQNDTQLMTKTIELIHKLDSCPSNIHLFNHFLKDLYIKTMTTDNRLKIQKLKQNYNPYQYFKTMKINYEKQQKFINQYFKSKQTELTLNDIIRFFYSNWISENWSYLFNDSQSLHQALIEKFQTIYTAIKLDEIGMKQFTIWYTELIANKLQNLKIINNESLVEEFSRLIKSTFGAISNGCDSLFLGKVKITFQNWLNNDSIDIANRLNNHINDLIVEGKQNEMEEKKFERKLGNSMLVFKVIKDKDLFELAYGKALVERMATLRYSRALEEVVLRLMREECGESWTSRIQTIIQENSNILSQSKQQSEKLLSNNIVTINQLHWHSLTAKQPIVNDPYLLQFQNNNTRLQGKQAKWLLNYGNGLLKMNLGKSFDLRVSTLSMQLLSYFNRSNELVLREYLQQFKYDIGTFRKTINCLVKSNILLSNYEISDISSIKNDLVLTLNVKYSPNGDNLVVMEQKEKQTLSLAKKQQLTEDRKLIIEAIITKIVKRIKVGDKSSIVQETLSIIDKKGFSASQSLVEDCFTPLEDRGYIEVVEDKVKYLP